MKKFLFTVGAIMCVALLSVCLSSCDEEKEPLAAIYTINSSRSNEVTKFADDPGAVAEAKANAEVERNKILTQTALDVEKMKQEAENDIARMELEAQDRIKKEMVVVALDASKELLGREVTSEDNTRLLEEFIEDVKKD